MEILSNENSITSEQLAKEASEIQNCDCNCGDICSIGPCLPWQITSIITDTYTGTLAEMASGKK
jgi:hypothetical protein